MLGASWLWCSSLRSKLRLAALAGLIATIALTALLLQSASSALEVVGSARQMNIWVQVNTDLLSSARDFEGASYRQVREPSADATEALGKARARFEHLIDETSKLRIMDDEDRRDVARIQAQSRILLAHFSHADALVRAVDAQWRKGGSRAALIEVNRLIKPHRDLDRVLRATIARSQHKVDAATDRAQSLINAAVIAAFIGLALVVGFSIIVLLLLELRLRPGLSSLQDGVQAFRQGALDRRIILKGEDELAQLAGAFNEMAARIDEKHQALHQVQDGLEQTIAARTDELQRAYARLSAMDERRRDFLADISHELRTPLTIIRGEAEVALRLFGRHGADPHDALERIFEQTQDLGRMVDELLLLALAESGGLTLDRKIVDVQSIANRVGRDFAVLAMQMGGTITVSAPEPIIVLADADKLRRAMSTLVENGLRHCPPGVNILIEAAVEGDQAMIAICDDGPGIDPAIAQQLCGRFKRGATHSEGSGLGLNLAQVLMEAHGGQLDLRSGPHGGTRAVLRLALCRANMEAA